MQVAELVSKSLSSFSHLFESVPPGLGLMMPCLLSTSAQRPALAIIDTSEEGGAPGLRPLTSPCCCIENFESGGLPLTGWREPPLLSSYEPNVSGYLFFLESLFLGVVQVGFQGNTFMHRSSSSSISRAVVPHYGTIMLTLTIKQNLETSRGREFIVFTHIFALVMFIPS